MLNMLEKEKLTTQEVRSICERITLFIVDLKMFKY